MGRLAQWIVLITCLFVPQAAQAFGGTTTLHYRHEAGTEIVWEHNKGRCPLSSSTCFVLFPVSDEGGSVTGTRLSRVSRTTGTPWVLGQRAEDGQFVLYDARTRTLVMATDDEGAAIARFGALAGAAPRLLDARNGKPRRPTLWRTPASLLEDVTCTAPVATIVWGVWLWPFYLLGMATFVALVRFASRKHGWAPTVVAVIASPAVPFGFFSYLALASG